MSKQKVEFNENEVKKSIDAAIVEVSREFSDARELQEKAAEKFNALLAKVEKLTNDESVPQEFLDEIEDNLSDIWYSQHGTRGDFEFWLTG